MYQRIVSLSRVRPGDSVLDVGSSSGYLAKKLAAAAGPAGHVTGVDPSEAAVAHARRHALPTMTFTVGVVQDLDLPDASYDVVTCTLAIHHIPARKREAAFRWKDLQKEGHERLGAFHRCRSSSAPGAQR